MVITELIRQYFDILSPADYPGWLDEYIAVPALQRQAQIGVSCGTTYTKLFEGKNFFSSLDHAIAVALIVWNFTHDKTQALAALFHDIATPAFKHCVDFMNGDFMCQESTEAMTGEIIASSSEIMLLLARDKIELDAVADYHLYPICDNEKPRLSADRLEYSLSNAWLVYALAPGEIYENWGELRRNMDAGSSRRDSTSGLAEGLAEAAEIYAQIKVLKNEDGEAELGFCDLNAAEKFMRASTQTTMLDRSDRARYSMQLIADILAKMISSGRLSVSELYVLSEAEIVERILLSDYGDAFSCWRDAEFLSAGSQRPKDVYCVHHEAKLRYIDPLVVEDGSAQRLSHCSSVAKQLLERNLEFRPNDYLSIPGLRL